MGNRPEVLPASHRPSNFLPWSLLGLGLMSAVLGAAGWYYSIDSHRERDEAYGVLETIGRLKVSQLISWRNATIANAQVYASCLSPGLLGQAVQSRAACISLMASGSGIENLIITDKAGNLRFSLNPIPPGLEGETQELGRKALASSDAAMGNFYVSSSGEVRIDTAAPISSDHGAKVGVLFLRHDPANCLFPMLESWPASVKSAETVLLRNVGERILIATPLRFLDSPPLGMSYPLTQTKRIGVAAVSRGQGLAEGVNYRGHEVIAYTVPVPGSDWILITMEDKSEILEPVMARGKLLALLTLLIAGLGGLGVFLLYLLRIKDDYKRLFRMEQERSSALALFETTVYSIGDGVITTDAQGRVMNLNMVACKLTGWSEQDARSRPLCEVFRIINEDTRSCVEDPVQRVLREGVVSELANHTVLIARDGGERPIADSGAPICSPDGTIVGCVLVFRDQSKQHAQDRELRNLLKQKDVLLHEVHHRVKNNLQLIASLLSLQSDQMMDEYHQSLFLVSQQRIKAIAEVHEMLYASHDFGCIDFTSYMHQLVAGLEDAYGRHDGIDVLFEGPEGISLDLDRAISCGLILNELVTNALKHAFPQGRLGRIKISCFREVLQNSLTLMVADDGIGLPKDYSVKSKQRLGMKLVELLTKQIGGELMMTAGSGVENRIVFPKKKEG